MTYSNKNYSKKSSELSKLRSIIADIDQNIISLIAQRIKVGAEIGKIKRKYKGNLKKSLSLRIERNYKGIMKKS